MQSAKFTRQERLIMQEKNIDTFRTDVNLNGCINIQKLINYRVLYLA